MLKTLLVPVVVLLAAPSPAAGQLPSIYVDLAASNSPTPGVPSPNLGAALGVPGVWNDVDVALSLGAGSLSVPVLLDTGGQASAVELDIVNSSGGFLAGVAFDEPFTTGDDALLMDDVMYFEGGAGTLTFSGLPMGTYDVYTYAMAPDSPSYATVVRVVGATTAPQVVAGDFSNGYASGDTHALHTVTVTGAGTITIETLAANLFDSINGVQIAPNGAGPSLGTNYCSATPNSTGVPGSISAQGNPVAAANDFTLVASQLPPGQFGIFVTSRFQGFTPNVGSGNLCLDGPIGRFQQPSQILQADASGVFSLAIDTGGIPQGNVLVPIASGDSWSFQAWHRDTTATGPTSNLTNGLEVVFL